MEPDDNRLPCDLALAEHAKLLLDKFLLGGWHSTIRDAGEKIDDAVSWLRLVHEGEDPFDLDDVMRRLRDKYEWGLVQQLEKAREEFRFQEQFPNMRECPEKERTRTKRTVTYPVDPAINKAFGFGALISVVAGLFMFAFSWQAALGILLLAILLVERFLNTMEKTTERDETIEIPEAVRNEKIQLGLANVQTVEEWFKTEVVPQVPPPYEIIEGPVAIGSGRRSDHVTVLLKLAASNPAGTKRVEEEITCDVFVGPDEKLVPKYIENANKGLRKELDKAIDSIAGKLAIGGTGIIRVVKDSGYGYNSY